MSQVQTQFKVEQTKFSSCAFLLNISSIDGLSKLYKFEGLKGLYKVGPLITLHSAHMCVCIVLYM